MRKRLPRCTATLLKGFDMNPQDKCWQVHRHLAEYADQRLTLVRNAPKYILLAGADADISRSLLAKRYPQAVFEEYDSRADFWRLPLPPAKAVFGKGLRVRAWCNTANPRPRRCPKRVLICCGRISDCWRRNKSFLCCTTGRAP